MCVPSKSEQTPCSNQACRATGDTRVGQEHHVQGFVGVAFVIEDDAAERILVLDLDDVHARFVLTSVASRLQELGQAGLVQIEQKQLTKYFR